MKYINFKKDEHVTLRTIADKIDEFRSDGHTHEILVQVQGNCEEIYQLQKDLWHGLGQMSQVETLDQDLLMLTFRTVVHNL